MNKFGGWLSRGQTRHSLTRAIQPKVSGEVASPPPPPTMSTSTDSLARIHIAPRYGLASFFPAGDLFRFGSQARLPFPFLLPWGRCGLIGFSVAISAQGSSPIAAADGTDLAQRNGFY